MSMADPAKLSEEELADLVAYLDGEADGETAAPVGPKLRLAPRARPEAEALRRTSALLDFLPRPDPSTDFTQRTVERLSAFRPATPSTALSRTRRRLL